MSLYHGKRYVYKRFKKLPLTAWAIRIRDQRKVAPVREVLKREGLDIAEDVAKRLKAGNVDVALFCGSMLGIVRDGHFLAHDSDMDFAFVLHEGFDWRSVEDALQGAGYRKHKEYRIGQRVIEQAYRYKALSFDIFGLQPVEDASKARLCYFHYEPGVKYSHPRGLTIDCMDFDMPNHIDYKNVDGHELPLFDNAERLLETQYGPNWRTPDPNWVDGTYMKRLDEEGVITLY